MEHIITRHMPPVKFGKSYFLSRDVTYVSNLVTQTTTNPDQILPHGRKKGRKVFKKNFPFQVGIHGYNGKPCYGIFAVKDITDDRLITAYPTLKW